MKISVIAATQDHAALLAPRLRAQDVAEISASTLLSPQDALAASLACSPMAWTGMVDDEPVCMFGVAATSWIAAEGAPWMLGSDALLQHQKAFLRRNRAYVALMRQMFSSLRNHVDTRNHVSIRWLHWLGFTLGPPEPYGPHGQSFHPFWME